MVTMIVSLSVAVGGASRAPPKKERGFYATPGSCASFLQSQVPGAAAGRLWPAPASTAREPRRHAPAPFEGSHEGAELAALHALHDALHLQELLEQAIDVLHLNARARGDAPPARAVDDPGVAPLARGHGVDDGDLAADLAIALVRRHPALLHGLPG